MTERTDHDECAALCEAVDKFAEAMKSKLTRKMLEGFRGWDDPHNEEHIGILLVSHVDRLFINNEPQEVDIANLAMMLWWQRISTDDGGQR